MSRACDEDADKEACSVLGHRHLGGYHLPRNSMLAAEYLARACDLGDEMDCWALGERLLHGDGVAPDAVRAVQLLTRACDAGSFHSLSFNGQPCDLLSEIYARGRVVPKNPELAYEFHERAVALHSAKPVLTRPPCLNRSLLLFPWIEPTGEEAVG
ncbi:MAG: sel1 repeat family protein, partial [Coriobacteriia bacterium]|nr:sel1 repeat family protein [Coriobacteriia bacterium]